MFTNHIHYSRELEAAILGACMLEKESFGRTFGLIEKENFYYDANQIVYDAIAEMYNNGFPVDIITVCDYLINRKGIKTISGDNVSYYVSRLTNQVVSTTNLEFHSVIIKRMWMEREVMKLTHGGTALEGEVKDKLQQLTKAIQKINQGQFTKDWSDMSELMYDLMKHQEEMLITGGKGVSTGIDVLDRENGGFFKGQMIVIGARPSVGKSAFMGQMAIAMAKKGTTVGIISLEMNNNEIAARLASIETSTDFKSIYRNLFRDENERANWYNKITNFTNTKIYVSDATDVNPMQIKAKAQKLKHTHNLGCLMIDYLQLVNGEGPAKNRTRENEVSQLSRACKLMAKELEIPVIILCQLNRAVTQRKGTNRYPQLSDLRESGSIEQDADVVMFIHRDWMMGDEYMVDENGQSTENKADLIIRKWRNGASNLHIPMEFDAPRMLFRQLNRVDSWQPESTNFNDDNPF